MLYDSVKSNDEKEDDDGVDDCVDDCFDECVDRHVDCCVNVAKEDGVDGSVDSGESHLTHLTHEADCGVRQNVCDPNKMKSSSVLFSAISNEGKEVSSGDDDGYRICFLVLFPEHFIHLEQQIYIIFQNLFFGSIFSKNGSRLISILVLDFQNFQNKIL